MRSQPILTRTIARCLGSATLAVWSAVLLGTVAPSAGAQFETPSVLKASQILPAELRSGPNHEVDEQVLNDGYLNHYTIQSRFGTLEATSTFLLHKRVGEFNAMAKMEQMEETKVFTEAVTEKAGDVARGAKNLVTDPVDTASGAVSGVGKLLDRASEAVTGGARSDAEESRVKDLIGFSKTKRDYAYELGVNVYSRNPKLQEALDDLAWTGYAGSISTSVAFAAIPGAAGAVVSVSGTTALLNKVFRDRAPTDLRKMNREKLQVMGVDANVIDLFIRNPVFTPREQTLLVRRSAR